MGQSSVRKRLSLTTIDEMDSHARLGREQLRELRHTEPGGIGMGQAQVSLVAFNSGELA